MMSHLPRELTRTFKKTGVTGVENSDKEKDSFGGSLVTGITSPNLLS